MNNKIVVLDDIDIKLTLKLIEQRIEYIEMRLDKCPQFCDVTDELQLEKLIQLRHTLVKALRK